MGLRQRIRPKILAGALAAACTLTPLVASAEEFMCALGVPPDPAPVILSRDLVPVAILTGHIERTNVDAVVDFLRAINASSAPVAVLEINTTGGSVEDGFRLVKAIERSKAKVFCVVDGEGASMGFYVLQACTKRYMTRRSVLMAHEVRMGRSSGPFTVNTATIVEMENDLAEIKASSRGYAEHCIRRMRISYREFESHVSSNRDWYMDWSTAVKMRAVDGAVDSVQEAVDLARAVR